MLSLLPNAGAHTTAARGYTPFTSPVAPDLGRAFAAACLENTPQTADDLRQATVTLVDRLKADRLPPERVIVAVKTALTRYGGCHVPPSFDLDDENPIDGRHAATYRRVFGWCLDAYYNAE